MKRDLFVEQKYAKSHLNLRGFLRDKGYSQEFFVIEHTSFTNNSIFVFDYQQLFDSLSESPDCWLPKISSVTDGQLLILHDFNIDIQFLSNWIIKISTDYKFPTKNIWVQIPFEKEGNELNQVIQNNGLHPVNILVYSEYINHTALSYEEYELSNPTINNEIPAYKFSIFARKFKDWRYKFFCYLIEKKLLKHFVYTFSNLDPEMFEYPHIAYPQNELIQYASKLGFTKLGDIGSFVNKLPVVLDTQRNSITNPFPIDLYNLYKSASINIVLETVIDRIYSGIIITEKTYKAIISETPFIYYGPPNGLHALRMQGFKTFHPFINEDYDSVQDSSQRMQFIIKEIERISNLNEFEFTQLLENCKKISKFNKKNFKVIQQSNTGKSLLSKLNL